MHYAMARAVGRPAGISTCRAHCQRTRPHHWRSQSTQSGPRRLGVAMKVTNCQLGSGSNWLMVYVLIYNYPKGVERKYVLPRGGPNARSVVPWRRRNIFVRAPVHQTQHHHHPHAPGVGRHHPGVVGEPAAGCIPSVPPVGGWGLGPARGEFLAPNSPLRPPPVCWRIPGPPGGPEIRWVLSFGWFPSKRVVVIHYARPYTVQKASGGCARARAVSGKCV
jgi:hypothetical protein